MRLVVFAILCLCAQASAKTDFSAWKDSARVYFNTTSTGAPITSPVRNFPLLIRLDSANLKLIHAAPGGGDFRFTDPDGVELPCHVERWDTGFYRSAEVWVNVPQVDAGSASDFVVVYWGNPSATMTGAVKVRQGGGDVYLGGDNAVGSRVVFDTAFGFAGVWHLDEDAAKAGAAAISSAEESPVQVVLEPVAAPGNALGNGVGSLSSLRLGAARFAVDGIGVEAEAMPPAAADGPSLASVRSGRGWKTDLLGYRPDAEFTWKLAWSAHAGAGSALARLRVASLRLPEGMTLWAISPLRKVAEPAMVGAELEVMGDASDTLIFWAAPKGRAFRELPQGFGPRPEVRSAAWVAGPSGGKLRLALPASTGLRAECRDASGRRLASLRRAGLAPGYYEFSVADAWESGTGAIAPGLMIVTVEFLDGADPGRMVFKSIRP
ncbi:MAG: hypothetical protein JWO30_2305 [Fibrobacteres bacterium]|nr:hypothetical protein [Fibrobacterota bacterium]